MNVVKSGGKGEGGGLWKNDISKSLPYKGLSIGEEGLKLMHTLNR